MSWKTGLVLAMLAALVLLLASCGKVANQPSGVSGIVLFSGGPVVDSPSPLPSGFGSGDQGRAYRFVTVQVKATTGTNAGKVAADVKPDSQALFRVALPPGGYRLTALVPKHGPVPRPADVTVKAGGYARVIVYVEGR